MCLYLLIIFAKNGRKVANFITFFLLFCDELKYIMEKLADVLLFLEVVVFVAMKRQKFAFENHLNYVIFHYGSSLLLRL